MENKNSILGKEFIRILFPEGIKESDYELVFDIVCSFNEIIEKFKSKDKNAKIQTSYGELVLSEKQLEIISKTLKKEKEVEFIDLIKHKVLEFDNFKKGLREDANTPPEDLIRKAL